ncbi:MAG: hypothetical protein PWP70_329 [Moorella sp. (in: firmicutes)]|nr:hypothetical protein [Moorella sp. (in: firmicutes)]
MGAVAPRHETTKMWAEGLEATGGRRLGSRRKANSAKPLASAAVNGMGIVT